MSSDKTLAKFTELVDKEEVNEEALSEIVANDLRFQELFQGIRSALSDSFSMAEECKMIFDPFLAMVMENQSMDIGNLKEQAQSGAKSLDEIKVDMDEFNDQKKKIDKLPLEAFLGLVQVPAPRSHANRLPNAHS